MGYTVRRVVLMVIVLISVTLVACEDPDKKCRDASRDASYSTDYQTMKDAMEYFSRNCTWRDGVPVAR